MTAPRGRRCALGSHPAVAWQAPVAQMAEAGGLNPLQHGFESHRGHRIGLPRSPSSLCLMARYARCDVRRKPPSSSDPTKRLCRKSALFRRLSSAPPADRRREHRARIAPCNPPPSSSLAEETSAHSSSERRERDPGVPDCFACSESGQKRHATRRRRLLSQTTLCEEAFRKQPHSTFKARKKGPTLCVQ